MNAMMRTLDTSDSRQHPSRHQWDLYLLDALSGADSQKLRGHLDGCERCQTTLHKLEAERDDWAQQATPAVFLARIQEAQLAEEAQLSWWDTLRAWFQQPANMAPLGALGLFAMIWVLAPATHSTRPVLTDMPAKRAYVHPPIQKKGGPVPVFDTYLFRKGKRSLARSGSQYQSGDVLGFMYSSKGYRYLFVITVDHKGAISWLYPGKASKSIPIAQQGRLKGSVELDDSSGRERLLAFFSEEALSASQIKRLIPKIHRSGHVSLKAKPHSSIYAFQLVMNKK